MQTGGGVITVQTGGGLGSKWVCVAIVCFALTASTESVEGSYDYSGLAELIRGATTSEASVQTSNHILTRQRW